GSITLTWNPGALSTHTIIRRMDNTPPSTNAPQAMTDGVQVYNERNDKDGQDPTDTHTYTDTGLGENIIYCYSAWAYDERTDMYSNGFVLACGGIPPSDPSGLSISSTTNSFTLSFTKGSASNTVIRRSINTAPTTIEEGTAVYNSTGSSFTDSDPTLTKNTTYCYSIWSYNPSTAALSANPVSGCGTLSNMASPTDLTFPTVAYNSIILNWTPGTGSTKTYIVRKQGSIPANKDDGTVIYNDSGNAFIDTGLTDNTQYCYALYGTDDTEYTEPITGCQTTQNAWVSGYNYSKSHTITGSTAGTQTDYQMMFKIYRTTGTDSGNTVYVGPKIDATYKDIYFTAADKVTPLSYWIESYDSTYATVWVKIPSIPANPSTTTIYLYYGNPSATSTSNGENTFEFFDDFEGTSINSSKWGHYTSGTVTTNISSSIATFTTGSSGAYNYIRSNNTVAHIPTNRAIRARARTAHFSQSSSPYYQEYIYLIGGAGIYSSLFFSYDSGYGKYFASNNGSGWVLSGQISGWSAGVWHTYELKRNASVSLIKTVDDANTQTATSGIFSSNSYIAIQTGGTGSTSGCSQSYDWVLVRKYISSEPSHSSWGEESDLSLSLFSKKKEIAINNPTGTTLTDYQVLINFDKSTMTSIKENLDDLRFGSADGESQYPYWIESVSGNIAKVWVRIPVISANTTTSIFMFYANENASSISNGDLVFDFFDGFSDSSLNLNKWLIEYSKGSYAISGGIMTVTGGTSSNYYESIRSNQSWVPQSYVFETYFKYGTDTTSGNNLEAVGYSGANNQFNIKHDYGGKYYATIKDGATQYTTRGNYFTNYSKLSLVSPSASSAQFYVNDVLVNTNNSNVPISSMNVILTAAYSEVSKVYVDWVLIRKYSPVQLDISIGAEL
ncbi:MAG: DUF2341 domain-containing protein, partial [Candidatus Pacebacteria bacterium]|nr:DUF2341 domain-containing protein [Candidatus Paceibacterota bacterium]